MTSSENSAKTLGDIIKKKKFVIPMYQRNYKWNTSVVIKLVDDILDCYNRSKKENNIQISKSLGLLTLYKKDEKDTTYYVIDGQQRFTTLSILLSVLHTNAESNIDLEFERDKSVCKKRRKAITGECPDECPDKRLDKCLNKCTDVNRINRNKEAICNKLENNVNAGEYDKIAKFILNNVIMLCSIVNEQPVEEFMNLNAYKTAFSISDHIRANLISLNSFYKEEMSKGEYGPILARCLSKKTYKTAVAILYNNIQEKLYDVQKKDENGTYKSIYDLLKEPKEILDPDKEARINIIFRGMLDKEAQNYASGEITENFDYWIKMLQKLAYVNKLLDELKNELNSGEFHSFKQIDDYQKMTGKSFVLEVFDGICKLDEDWNSQILAKEIQKYSNVDSVLIRCLNQDSKKLANRYLEAFVYSNVNEETIKKADNESGEKIKLSQMAMDEVVDEISGCGRFVVDRYEREHREDLDMTITIPPVIDLEDRENVNFGGSLKAGEIEGGDLIKIGDLFNHNIKIPVIQRDYCMGARITGKNDFLDYLISGFEKNEKKEKGKKESLIASTILISISKDGSIYIFDGQQRTFTLYNILKYCNNKDEERKSYSFIGRTEENANDTGNCGSPYSKQAVDNLNKILEQKIEENKDDFASYIKDNVKLKVKIVESVSGAEQFFMDINGGVALEKYEIFKAMLCNRLAVLDGFDGLDVIRNIENEWLDFFYKYRRDYLGSKDIQKDESDIEELLEIRFIEFVCRFVYQMNHLGAKYEDIWIKNGDEFSKLNDSTYGNENIIKDSTLSRPKSFDEIGSKGEMVTGLSYIDVLDVQDFEMIRSVLNEITKIDNTSNDEIPDISLEEKKIATNSTDGSVTICGLKQEGTKQDVLKNKGYYIKRFIWSLVDENRRILKNYYRYENDERIIEKIYDHDQIMRDILLSILKKDVQGDVRGYVQGDVQGYVYVYPYQINEKKCNIIYCGYRHNEDNGYKTLNVGKREVEYNCIKEIPAYYYNEIDKKINNDSEQIVRLRYLQDKSGQQKDNYKFALVKNKVKNQIEYEDKTNSNICLANNFLDNVECINRTEAYCITYIERYITKQR